MIFHYKAAQNLVAEHYERDFDFIFCYLYIFIFNSSVPLIAIKLVLF